MNQGSELLTNQLYRPSRERLTPALGFGFAVDGGGGIMKNLFPFFRSTPKKCHCGQAGAFRKGPFPNTSDAVTNRDTRQGSAGFKGPFPDAGNAIRNGNAR